MDNANIVSDETRETLCTIGTNEQGLVDFSVILLEYMYNIFLNHIFFGNYEQLPTPNDHPPPFYKISNKTINLNLFTNLYFHLNKILRVYTRDKR